MSEETFRALVRQRGLLRPQPAYYAGLILFTLALLALGITGLWWWEDLRLQLANAAFLAFVFGQIGVIGHDADHGQVFRSARRNDAIGVAVTLLTGLERSWWRRKHTAHHRAPNQEGRDPDIEISVIACSEKQAREKSRLLRPIVAFQALWFFPLCCLQGLNWQLTGARFVVKEELDYPVAERIAMFGHLALYYGLLFGMLAPLHAVLFVVVHQSCFGLYIALMFAPNHMGLPLLDGEAELGFIEHQVRFTRSVRSNRLLDYAMCGLNRQVEHHVFPAMSRNKLREVRPLLVALCRARGLPYQEAGLAECYRDILRELHLAGAPLRRAAG